VHDLAKAYWNAAILIFRIIRTKCLSLRWLTQDPKLSLKGIFGGLVKEEAAVIEFSSRMIKGIILYGRL
jgi:hypothetical protein